MLARVCLSPSFSRAAVALAALLLALAPAASARADSVSVLNCNPPAGTNHCTSVSAPSCSSSATCPTGEACALFPGRSVALCVPQDDLLNYRFCCSTDADCPQPTPDAMRPTCRGGMCVYVAGSETIGGCPAMNVDAGLPDVVVTADVVVGTDVVGGIDADPADAPMSRDVQSTADTAGGRDGSNAGDANGSDAGTELDATEPSDSSVALDGAGEPDGGAAPSEKFGFRGSGCQCATVPGGSGAPGSAHGVRAGVAALLGLLVARRRARRAPRA